MLKNNRIFFLAKEKLGAVILVGLLAASLSFLFLAVNEKNFKAETEFLVVQNHTGAQDFYSLAKSAEYLSSVFSESIYTELFISEAVKTGKINEELLPFNKRKRLDEWSKIVKTRKDSQKGIITVDVFHDSPKKARDISEAIIEVMTEKNYLFRGEGSLDVRVLSGPIIERNPSLSNIVMAAGGGFALGVLISLIGIYYKEERDSKPLRAVIDKNREYEEYKKSFEYLER